MNSLKNEINYLFSGIGMPYEKICMIVAVFVAVVFTAFLGENMARDVPVAVIDLDHSRYSQEVIEKIDSTPYMKVNSVVYAPEEPQKFMIQDKNYAVIVLPKDLEKQHYAGQEGSIGLFCDNSNTALDADIRASLNEIVGTVNAQSASVSGGQSGSLQLNERLLFNPSNSACNSEILGFVVFFGTIFFTFATIGMVPRLRETPEWAQLLGAGNPFALAARLLPYLFGLFTGTLVGMAILRLWGDMVFAGRLADYIISQILFLPSLGLMSVLFGWGAANPGVASSRMLFLVPAGFILSGEAFPLSLFPQWVIAVSHFFPLTWQFHFIRDIVVRGASLTQMPDILGGYLLYLAAILAVFCWRFLKERDQLQRTEELQQAREARWEE